MFSWLAKAMLNRNMARLREGDYVSVLKIDAKDIRFRFPGDSSWAAEIDNRDDHGRWLRRFVDTGLKLDADEIIAQGPPWNMTLCVRGISYLDTEDGRVYENRYVMWGRMSWGLLREYEVYEDTQATKALDEYLSQRESISVAPT
jgi:ketosteroid isomerase-like protein